jgi:hypothetical protein
MVTCQLSTLSKYFSNVAQKLLNSDVAKAMYNIHVSNSLFFFGSVWCIRSTIYVKKRNAILSSFSIFFFFLVYLVDDKACSIGH